MTADKCREARRHLDEFMTQKGRKKVKPKSNMGEVNKWKTGLFTLKNSKRFKNKSYFEMRIQTKQIHKKIGIQGNVYHVKAKAFLTGI